MQEFINYKNSKIAYSDIGKGGAIVLLHGFLENAAMWNGIANELKKNNRVICIDLLGHGNSECIGYMHSMEDMAEAVKAVLKHLRVRRFFIIGHSMGGYVSLAFAEKYSENIKGLCLLNSTSQADSEERKEIRLKACEVAQTNYASLIKMSIVNLFAEETRKEFLFEIDEVKKEALKTPLQGYIAATQGMRLRKSKENVLKQIEKRLIISGENDPIINKESIREEAKRTKTPIQFLSNGHMSHIENKEEVIKMLKTFVK